jgi:predicted esterase
VKRLAATMALVLGPFVAAAPAAPEAAAETAAPPRRVTVEVEGDVPAEAVLGPKGSAAVLVYLHGQCGDPLAFESWAKQAAEHATLVSVRGDLACKTRKGRRQWSFEPKRIDRRIDRAVQAVDAARREALGEGTVALDRTSMTLAGYSQGAHRAQALVWRFPDKYRRVLLAAMTTEPNVDALRGADRIVLLAGELDDKEPMRVGAQKLEEADEQVLYLVLPGARHGQYGDHAPEVLGKALDWLFNPDPKS